MLLQAPSGGAARRVTHPAVVHRGRPVRQATLTAAFKGGGPINPKIPAKYKAKPKGRPSTAPSLRLPSIGKPGKGSGGVATPVLSSSAAPGPGNPRVSLPPPAPISVYANPFRGIAGLVPQRIDQGVDYSAPAGSAIHAIGPGKIIDASTASGWPGGGFIAEQLTAGPAKGHVWYTAEDVTPNVKAGQVVTPKTVIGKFAPGGSIETGWGTEGGNVGNAIASGPAYGQPTEAAQGGDPGAVATGWGQAASRLLHSLGAPAGILNQPKSGGAPAWASAPGGKYVPSKATSSPLPPAIPVSFTSPLPASGSGGGTAAHAAAVSRKPSGPPAKIKSPASPATSSTGISSTGLGSGPPVTTTGIGTPGTTTTVTTTTVPGNVPISSTGPFPSPYTTLWGTTGTTSGTSTVLLVGGAALLVLFLVMDARKGRRGGVPAAG